MNDLKGQKTRKNTTHKIKLAFDIYLVNIQKHNITFIFFKPSK